jgi:predicted TPR repeat methyltransferase
MNQVGRNDPCPCGSGRKYKKCCMQREGVPLPGAPPSVAQGEEEAIQLALEHQRSGRLPQAAAIYQQILSRSPNHPDVLHYMGMAAHEIGEDSVAVDLIGRALKIAPGYAEAHNNLGNVLFGQEKFHEAAACYRSAIVVEPDYAEAHCNLGGTFYRLGKMHEALACFEHVLGLEPENGMALHMIAAIRGAHSEHAPPQYVTALFNAYANRFDTHLAQGLAYDIPRRLVAMIMQHAKAGSGKWDVLDLGCGTGLVGAQIVPRARQLAGVDLSSRMLEKARQRGIYTKLVEADLLAMLQGEPAAAYDVITSADVFIYVGKIDAVVAEVSRALRPGGLFAFSVETLEQRETQEYRLTTSGRFAHATAYTARLASAHGFEIAEAQPARIRIENGVPVAGFIELWQNKAG